MTWERLREWVRYIIVAFVGATLEILLTLYREARQGLPCRAGERSAGLLGQNWADRHFERRSQKWLAEECERVFLIGVFPSERPERRRPFRESTLAEGAELCLPSPEKGRPVSLSEALGRRTVVILGEPGAGKSILLRYLALAFAHRRLGGLSLLKVLGMRAREWLPALLPLREYAASERPLAEFAEEHVRRQTRGVLNPPPGYFDRQVRQYRCLFFLDGLDEVLGLGDAAYQGICGAVNVLATMEEKNHVILTSRIAGWRRVLSPNFSILTIDPFNKPRREEFIRKWYEAAEAGAAGRETPEGAEIRQARERAALYHCCTELLLERWDVGRGIEDRGVTGLTLPQKELSMCQIDYHFHEQGVRFLSRQEVESLVAGVLPSLGQPRERVGGLSDWVERRTGLLADGEYLTFQECLAAGAVLSDERLRERLLETDRFFDPRWREVVLLCAGMADFIRQIYSSCAASSWPGTASARPPGWMRGGAGRFGMNF